ncbi:dihydrofolate reductase [Chelativorans sp. YIM 93263]|uniref:dihydrofolate reductase n=1 Tax=Chelativorans sp. YIM 93263 TaxID=2906648 RepID=UPI0023786B44|nr:dihydrofolate reductase [Chelativorans sp. YIM 93263]
MELSFVVAVTKNGVIGREGGLPWRLSTDLKRFKAITMGKPIVMGRKTWESLGRALPGRLNIVVTRDPDYSAEGAKTATSLDEAVAIAEEGSETGCDEICIIGGGDIFREAMLKADRLYVTHIEAEIDGDTFFPAIDEDIWQPISSETVPVGEKDIYPTRYVVYERRTPRENA